MSNQEQGIRILQNYFRDNPVSKFQIDSFNHFIEHDIKKIIQNEPDIEVKFPISNSVKYYKLSFKDVYIGNPVYVNEHQREVLLYPNEARQKNITYESPIKVSIEETINNKTYFHNRIDLTKIPVMVGSKLCNLQKMNKQNRTQYYNECPKDDGGYFIVKGTERIIVSQIRNVYNRIIVFKKNTDIICQIRSMSTTTKHQICMQMFYNIVTKQISIQLPYVKKQIPINTCLYLFNILNIISYDIFENIKNKFKNMNLEKCIKNEIFIKPKNSIDKILHYIKSKLVKEVHESEFKQYLSYLLQFKLFPHLGIDPNINDVIDFLCIMLKKLILTIQKKRKIDNMDDLCNKRFDTTGTLCYDLLGMLFKKFLSNIKLSIVNKKKTNIKLLFNTENTINNALHMSFATGNWGIPKSTYIRPGVSQVIMRYCYISYLAHMRRIMIPGGKENKNVKIRQIHTSQFGFICPNETPEGQQCGLVLNYALLTKISNESSPLLILEIINPLFDPVKNINNCIILINGKLVGTSLNYKKILTCLKKAKLNLNIHHHVTFYYNHIDHEINIWCDRGRCLRPLLKVNQDNKIIITQKEEKSWKTLLHSNKIQYLDPTEIKQYVIASSQDSLMLKRKFDYCEIHPCVILGILGNSIPFVNHNPSPRNTYQCNMGKQAIGTPILSYNFRGDTSTHIMDYNQKPLVNSKIARFLKLDNMPFGNNVVVAILSYTGYNQEDSIIMNKASIEKGLFVCTTYRTISGQERKLPQNSTEMICLPPKNNIQVSKSNHKYFKRKYGNYSKLGPNGIIKTHTSITLPNGNIIQKRTFVRQGDVVIGKVIKEKYKNVEKVIDSSIVAAKNEEGYIHNIITDKTANGYTIVKIVIKKQRIPEIGDKFASRSAQKGVIGMILRQDQMPFNEDGITPDIIINPHCIPSRMTINQLMECILGKTSCINGTLGNATAFENITADQLCNELKKSGLKANKTENNGWEYMYDGFTGEKIKCRVFMGPTYYQRLKHMVSDKVYARTTGNITTFMRQPVEGRSRDGGLKFGEMERDAMLAHGTTYFIKEKLFDNSDKFNILICKKCNTIVNSTNICYQCDRNDFALCDFPYASKVFIHELMAMGIKINFIPFE